METVQTSFIPKRTLARTEERPGSRPPGIFIVLASALLVLSLVFLGGAYGYQRWLGAEINRPCEEVNDAGGVRFRRCGLVATVELEEKNLDRGTIVLLQRLDRKFKIATELIARHTNVVPVFSLLEELTLPTLAYTKFNFLPAGITIAGQAASYEDIAIQSDLFGRERNRIKSFIFSDLDLDSEGRVVFKLVLELDPEIYSYVKTVSL